MYAEHLLANARLAARREAASRRRAARPQHQSRPVTPHGARVALGQLLVRTGERLSGTSPGHA